MFGASEESIPDRLLATGRGRRRLLIRELQDGNDLLQSEFEDLGNFQKRLGVGRVPHPSFFCLGGGFAPAPVTCQCDLRTCQRAACCYIQEVRGGWSCVSSPSRPVCRPKSSLKNSCQ